MTVPGTMHPQCGSLFHWLERCASTVTAIQVPVIMNLPTGTKQYLDKMLQGKAVLEAAIELKDWSVVAKLFPLTIVNLPAWS